MGFQSALLVSTGAIIGSSGCSILAWWAGLTEVAAVLTAVAAIGLVSRLWGAYALKHVEVTVSAGQEAISAGQSVTVRYSIENKKVIPLVWLELCQDVPLRGCLVPDDSFQLRSFSKEEAEHAGRKEAYMRRMSFLMGWSELEWETVWTGVCRGVYRFPGLVLRSGDGFGLCQSISRAQSRGGRCIVVWPRIVPVKTGPFLRHVWSGSAGRAGWNEDPTVMKGIRAYQPGDPWKRIDWRIAARTDELMVRQFDTVTPMSILFVLDAASMDDREEGISLLASLILELEQNGVECGLALPAVGKTPPLLLRPDDPSVAAGQCLFALSEFAAEKAGGRFDERGIMACGASVGQVWIVTGSAGRISCPGLAGMLSQYGVRLLSEISEPGIAAAQECTFPEIRRREAQR